MDYLQNIGVASSHLLNAFIGSHKRMTLSGRAYLYYKEGEILGRLFVNIINKIFFWDEDHCKRSWENDVKHAGQIMSIHARLKR